MWRWLLAKGPLPRRISFGRVLDFLSDCHALSRQYCLNVESWDGSRLDIRHRLLVNASKGYLWFKLPVIVYLDGTFPFFFFFFEGGGLFHLLLQSRCSLFFFSHSLFHCTQRATHDVMRYTPLKCPFSDVGSADLDTIGNDGVTQLVRRKMTTHVVGLDGGQIVALTCCRVDGMGIRGYFSAGDTLF